MESADGRMYHRRFSLKVTTPLGKNKTVLPVTGLLMEGVPERPRAFPPTFPQVIVRQCGTRRNQQTDLIVLPISRLERLTSPIMVIKRDLASKNVHLRRAEIVFFRFGLGSVGNPTQRIDSIPYSFVFQQLTTRSGVVMTLQLSSTVTQDSTERFRRR